MSVLKKLQFADAPWVGVADLAIIVVGVVDCQKHFRLTNIPRIASCSIVAR